MNKPYLDFEQPIAELEEKINALRMVDTDNELDIAEEIKRLEQKCSTLTQKIFQNLSPWQIVQLSRHPLRPLTADYIPLIFDSFDELFGDRHYSAAPAIIGGIAQLGNRSVMVIGHQKGRKTKEKVYRNFGMARPEEYRRALRLMQLANKFSLPIITLIDTAGAYPGIGAEERNQSEAIAKNLQYMFEIDVPIIAVVTGEAGSGGALAIGVGDAVFMLEYSIYSVISPEGCASILWKSAANASEAAEAMGITAEKILDYQIIDGILQEPLGGAHKAPAQMSECIKQKLIETLAEFDDIQPQQLKERRYQKFLSIGRD